MPTVAPQIFYVMLAFEVLTAVPAGLSLRRLGFSPLWALTCFVPILAVAALWLLAFSRWPRDAQPQP